MTDQATVEYQRNMAEKFIPALDRDEKEQARLAHDLRLGVTTERVPASDALVERIKRAERLGIACDACEGAVDRITELEQPLKQIEQEAAAAVHSCPGHIGLTYFTQVAHERDQLRAALIFARRLLRDRLTFSSMIDDILTATGPRTEEWKHE